MYTYFGDESGDVGYSSKSSEYFIYALLKVKNRDVDRIRKEMKKLMRNLIGVQKNRLNYFHASNENEVVREKLLKLFIRFNIKIIYRVEKKIREVSYKNFVISLGQDVRGGEEIIVFSRYDTRKSVNTEIENSANGYIKIEETQKDFLLQLADFLAWVAFQKYERKNEKYYNLIENRILNKAKPLGHV